MKNRTGEKYITNEGYQIEIIEYRGNKYCSVKFENGHIETNKQYVDILKGEIKNPFHPSICGVGFIGVGKFNPTKNQKIYSTWSSMMQRGYSDILHKKYPTYKGCLVDKSWHNFQNFAEWFYENYNPETMEGWHLDKDILVKGNKMYSPETCCFVPICINKLFIKSDAIRGDFPIGINRIGKKFIARIRKIEKREYIGTFDTPEKAFQAYKVAKEDYIKEVSDKWKGLIDPKMYQAMYNYKVEITD